MCAAVWICSCCWLWRELATAAACGGGRGVGGAGAGRGGGGAGGGGAGAGGAGGAGGGGYNGGCTTSSTVEGSYPTLVMWFRGGSLDPFYRWLGELCWCKAGCGGAAPVVLRIVMVQPFKLPKCLLGSQTSNDFLMSVIQKFII